MSAATAEGQNRLYEAIQRIIHDDGIGGDAEIVRELEAAYRKVFADCRAELLRRGVNSFLEERNRPTRKEAHR